MPFSKGMYVRYWDGRTVAYGKVEEVREDSCLIRVGGTTRTREVRLADISIHPAAVASGRLMGSWALLKLAMTDRFLYHATASDLIASIATAGQLTPRSRVDWRAQEEGSWGGAEVDKGRTPSPEVDMAAYFREVSATDARTGSPPTRMGDVGEFLYATSRIEVAVNYVMAVHKAGKSPVVFRFKNLGKPWYADPKSTAVMTMNPVPLAIAEAKFVPLKLLAAANSDPDAEDAIEKWLADSGGWRSCASGTWAEAIDMEILNDKFGL